MLSQHLIPSFRPMIRSYRNFHSTPLAQNLYEQSIQNLRITPESRVICQGFTLVPCPLLSDQELIKGSVEAKRQRFIVRKRSRSVRTSSEEFPPKKPAQLISVNRCLVPFNKLVPLPSILRFLIWGELIS